MGFSSDKPTCNVNSTIAYNTAYHLRILCLGSMECRDARSAILEMPSAKLRLKPELSTGNARIAATSACLEASLELNSPENSNPTSFAA